MANHHFLTFTDPHDYRSRLRGADQEVMILARGDYRAELTHLEFDNLLVQRSRQTLPHVATAGAHPGLTTIVMLSDAHQPEIRVNGIAAGYGDVLVLGAGAEHHHRAGEDSRWGSTTMPTARFEAAAHALLGREMPPPPTTRMVTPDPMALGRLRSLQEKAVTLAAAQGGMHANVAAALRNALAETMVACLASDRQGAASIRLDGRSAAAVRRFMQLVEQDLGRPLFMIELCEELGVAGRTLRQYCLGHLGMSPNRYLWLRRMNLARRALARGAGGTTVTQVANEYGFGELGRFAVRYRQLFGETPSATLRRSATVPVMARGSPGNLSRPVLAEVIRTAPGHDVCC
nr:helix-turn-helix domain-containing protein [uncultured Rhodopila sp.]